MGFSVDAKSHTFKRMTVHWNIFYKVLRMEQVTTSRLMNGVDKYTNWMGDGQKLCLARAYVMHILWAQMIFLI